jgi:hypothetical protein
VSEAPQGYKAFWLRVARHVRLSEAGKALGLRPGDLSKFEQGQEHPLTPEQIAAYVAYLEAIPVPEPEVPEIVEENEP